MTVASVPITQDILTVPRKLQLGPINLVGLPRAELRDTLIEAGTNAKKAKMRVSQIWQWIYQKGVREFDQMTNLSKDYRTFLKERFVVLIPEVV